MERLLVPAGTRQDARLLQEPGAGGSRLTPSLDLYLVLVQLELARQLLLRCRRHRSVAGELDGVATLASGEGLEPRLEVVELGEGTCL